MTTKYAPTTYLFVRLLGTLKHEMKYIYELQKENELINKLHSWSVLQCSYVNKKNVWKHIELVCARQCSSVATQDLHTNRILFE